MPGIGTMKDIPDLGNRWAVATRFVGDNIVPDDRRANPLDAVWAAIVRIPMVRDWRVVREAAFGTLSFAIGLFWFITMIVVGSIGAGLLVVGIGVPILAALMALMIFGAQQERGRLRYFLAVDIPSPYRDLPQTGSPWRKALGLVRNPQLLRDGLYLLALFPLGAAALFLVWTPIQMLLSVPLFVFLGSNSSSLGIPVTNALMAILVTFLGAILIIPFSMLLNLLTQLHIRVAESLLRASNEEALIERVEELTESRSAVMRAMHLERRRIERDLHDGAQQRLVSLAMELGLARQKMESDPEGARKLLDESHEDAKLVLSELRDLVRGIHPAVLTDRGLDAAISAIAGRSPIPVDVRVNLDTRQPEEVEGTAYFVIVEALTNIAKHSQATKASVTIDRRGGWLRLQISDNGIGGADFAAGSGLRGLRDRIEALDGTMRIESPVGAGTTMVVEIPAA